MHLWRCYRRRSQIAPGSRSGFGSLPPLDADLGGLFQEATLLSFPIALALGGALVVLLLALGERDLAFHFVALPVHRRRDAGVAFLVRLSEQPRDLLLVEEQF